LDDGVREEEVGGRDYSRFLERNRVSDAGFQVLGETASTLFYLRYVWFLLQVGGGSWEDGEGRFADELTAGWVSTSWGVFFSVGSTPL
jgi:hypothetical protein